MTLSAVRRALLAPARRLEDAWSALVFYWHTSDKSHLAFALFMAVPLATIVVLTRFAYADQLRLQAERHRRVELACLAENIYFEARGEPLAGQFAVAEVTLNRVASPLFPATVCAVVHEARWDPARQRRVGAFSWTELDSVPTPAGVPWQRAMAVATAAYDNQEAPLVAGALFYHATRITPAWASDKTRVRRIGRHLFYE